MGSEMCIRDRGNHAAVRQPISWAMLSAGKTSIPRAVTGVMFCGSICVLRFSLLTRASEIFAETSSRFHETYNVRLTNVAFCNEQSQLTTAQGRPLTASRFGLVGLRVTSCV